MKRFRSLDYLVIFFSFSVVIVSVFWSASPEGGEKRAEIEASGEIYILPLSRDDSLVLTGPVGKTRVEVSGGEVFISDSDCRDKICVAMGRISTPSSWVACLPNRVFVRIVAGNPAKEAGVDAGAY